MTIEEKRTAIGEYCNHRDTCQGCPLQTWSRESKEDCYYFITAGNKTQECYDMIFGNNSQAVKADSGKPKLTLVPLKIIYDIAEVREYGVQKYHDPDNWKRVEMERYRDAAFRHFLAYLKNPDGVDEESGISHLKHLACNIAFLCELEAGKQR